MGDNYKTSFYRAKEEYTRLLKNNDLELLFPELSGKWEVDKKDFIFHFNQVEIIIKDGNNLVLLDEDEEEEI